MMREKYNFHNRFWWTMWNYMKNVTCLVSQPVIKEVVAATVAAVSQGRCGPVCDEGRRYPCR